MTTPLNRCLKCGNKKSYTEVQISGLFHTYMQIFSPQALKMWSGHRLRRKKPIRSVLGHYTKV